MSSSNCKEDEWQNSFWTIKDLIIEIQDYQAFDTKEKMGFNWGSDRLSC